MKRNKKWFYSILCLLVFVSITACRKTQVSAEEMEEYVVNEENGLMQSSQENNIRVQAIFRPTDLLVVQEMKSVEHVKESHIKELKDKYKRNIYITVNISNNGRDPLYQSGDQSNYGEKLKQLAFRIAEKASLITSSQDTILANDHVFSPMYNISGAVSILFVFSDVSTTEYEWIDFELKDPGLNTGDRKFRFERKNIEKIPEVVMNFK